MVKVQNASFSLGSRASQITSVCPISKRLPDSMLHVTLGVTPELSVTFGSFQTAGAVDAFKAVSFVWFTGQIRNIGSSVSIWE